MSWENAHIKINEKKKISYGIVLIKLNQFYINIKDYGSENQNSFK